MSEITQEHLQGYIDYKTESISANTAIKHYINLNQCFKKAARDGIIRQNPMLFVIKPKLVVYRGAQIYEADEMANLINALGDAPLDILIKLTLFYGLRRSEVLGLKWKAIDFSRKTLIIEHTVTKVGSHIHREDDVKRSSSFRTLPLVDTVYEDLVNLKAQQEENKRLYPNNNIDSEYVFTREDGRPLQPQSISHYFKRVLTKNGLKVIRFHDLRHSAGSFLHSKGYDLKQIQEWLGHGSVATTLKYLHITTEQKQRMGAELNNAFQNFTQPQKTTQLQG